MNVYQYIEDYVVSQMTPVVTLTQIETLTSTSFKLYTCNTQWVTVGNTITIDGENYKVSQLSIDEYIVVTGTNAPVQLYFQVAQPTFEHGNHRKVNVERLKQKNKTLITPLVYMLPVRNNRRNDYDSPYSFEGTVRIFFLANFNQLKSDIDTQQDEVIEPMRKMSEYFIEKINARQDIFEDALIVADRDWMEWGNPQLWGNNERIFDENLSGVEIEFELKIFDVDNCCTDVVADSCLPARILINEVLEDTAPSGQDFDLTVVDTNGDTPVTTYDENTKTLTVPASGGSASIDIDINGTSFVTNQSTNIDIPVLRTSDDSPTGFKIGSIWYIDGSVINLNGTNIYNSAPDEVLDLFVKNSAGTNVGTPDVTTVVADATNTFQGSPISGVIAEGSKAITVAYENGTPVGTATTDTTSALHIEIPNPVIPTPSGGLYKSGIINSYTGGDEGNDPSGIGHDWYLLSIDNSWLNEFGNNLRFTGTTGGGYNGSAYVDVDGNPTTKALAYPNDIMLIWNKYNQSAGNVLALMFNPLTSASLTSHLSSQPFTYDGKNNWKVMTYNELGEFTRINQSANGFLDYPPLDYVYSVAADRLWTRTPGETVDQYYFFTGVFISRGAKGTSYKTMVTRLYTLTELGL